MVARYLGLVKMWMVWRARGVASRPRAHGFKGFSRILINFSVYATRSLQLAHLTL